MDIKYETFNMKIKNKSFSRKTNDTQYLRVLNMMGK